MIKVALGQFTKKLANASSRKEWTSKVKNLGLKQAKHGQVLKSVSKVVSQHVDGECFTNLSNFITMVIKPDVLDKSN